jgi:hypothetical protein
MDEAWQEAVNGRRGGEEAEAEFGVRARGSLGLRLVWRLRFSSWVSVGGTRGRDGTGGAAPGRGRARRRRGGDRSGAEDSGPTLRKRTTRKECTHMFVGISRGI